MFGMITFRILMFGKINFRIKIMGRKKFKFQMVVKQFRSLVVNRFTSLVA